MKSTPISSSPRFTWKQTRRVPKKTVSKQIRLESKEDDPEIESKILKILASSLVMENPVNPKKEDNTEIQEFF